MERYHWSEQQHPGVGTCGPKKKPLGPFFSCDVVVFGRFDRWAKHLLHTTTSLFRVCPFLSLSISFPHFLSPLTFCFSLSPSCLYCLTCYFSPSLSLSHSVSLCLSVSLSLSHSVSLCLSVSLSLAFCLSLALSLSLLHSVSLFLSLTRTFSLFVSLSLPLCLFLSRASVVSLCVCVFLCGAHNLGPGQSLSLCLSLSLTLSLCLCPPLTLSLSLSISLSRACRLSLSLSLSFLLCGPHDLFGPSQHLPPPSLSHTLPLSLSITFSHSVCLWSHCGPSPCIVRGPRSGRDVWYVLSCGRRSTPTSRSGTCRV